MYSAIGDEDEANTRLCKELVAFVTWSVDTKKAKKTLKVVEIFKMSVLIVASYIWMI